jgi:hypothetical protein
MVTKKDKVLSAVARNTIMTRQPLSTFLSDGGSDLSDAEKNDQIMPQL